MIKQLKCTYFKFYPFFSLFSTLVSQFLLFHQLSSATLSSPSSPSVVDENLRSLRRDATVRQFKLLLDSNPNLLHEVG